jgi:hypothetical protein
MATVGTKLWAMVTGRWPPSQNKSLYISGAGSASIFRDATTENKFLTEQVNIPKLCTMIIKNKSKS